MHKYVPSHIHMCGHKHMISEVFVHTSFPLYIPKVQMLGPEATTDYLSSSRLLNPDSLLMLQKVWKRETGPSQTSLELCNYGRESLLLIRN